LTNGQVIENKRYLSKLLGISENTLIFMKVFRFVKVIEGKAFGLKQIKIITTTLHPLF